MKLHEYKTILIAIGLIGALIIASPTIASFIHLPPGEQFSELYLLGPERMAQNYPYNIAIDQNYSIYLNVANHLGSTANYVLYVKLGNLTESMPNATSGTPSPLSPIYEYRFSIQDNQTWTSPLTFSVPKATMQATNSQINTLKIQETTLNVEKPAIWNTNTTTFSYRLIFELWPYDTQTSSIAFNSQYLTLQLNLARTI